VFVDNDESFLDDEGVHVVVVFSLVDKRFLVCNERLSGGVITFRKRRLFVRKSVDRSISVYSSHDFKS